METDWDGMYSAAMDSVDLLDNGKPDDMTEGEWTDAVTRNVDHLKIVMAKQWPVSFDLTPFADAIAAHE